MSGQFGAGIWKPYFHSGEFVPQQISVPIAREYLEHDVDSAVDGIVFRELEGGQDRFDGVESVLPFEASDLSDEVVHVGEVGVERTSSKSSLFSEIPHGHA